MEFDLANLLGIAISSVFVSNILLSQFLGMCSFLECSQNIKTAFGLGVAVIFVSSTTAPLNWCILEYLLREDALDWLGLSGVNLEFLSFITFIAVIATFVQIVEMALEKFSPALYSALGIFLPLITVNCAILGVSLFMVEKKYTFIQTCVFGFSSGVGWFLAIIGLAAIRWKMKYSNVPKGLEGLGITFLVTGLMSMAFMCFSGVKF